MNSMLDYNETKALEGGASFSLSHRWKRMAWNVTWALLASWTPPPLREWRRFLLKLFGARLGRLSDVRGSAKVWLPENLSMGDLSLIAEGAICYNMAPIALHDGVIVSQRSHLCAGTHDVDDPTFQILARPITLMDGAWIAAEAFVGPGVTVGKRAVLGARAVAFKTIPDNAIFVGNPARFVRERAPR